MGRKKTKGGKWINIAHSLAGIASKGAEILNNLETERTTRQMRKETVPVIRTNLTAVTSYIGDRKTVERWDMYVSGLGVAAQFLQVLQGSCAQEALQDIGVRIAGSAEAQIGLIAPEKFAKQVHSFIIQETAKSCPEQHLDIFFLYHPDTDWDPALFSRIKDQPLSSRFLGMSENLDTLVVWMRFLKVKMHKQKKEIHIHLLIPAYRPMVTGESLAFPAELMPLTIHGHVHNSKPYVWLNLPQPNSGLELIGVGNLADVPLDETKNSIPTVLLGGVATVAAACLGGGPAAAAVGTYFFRSESLRRTQFQRPFISDADPRTLGEGTTEDPDDDRSSDDDEKRQARRQYPATRRFRQKQQNRDRHRGRK